MLKTSDDNKSNDQHKCQHVAIIMDGNGRWAKKRHLPRFMGHKEGAKAVKSIVIAAQKAGIAALTLYAFSAENWRRPASEVSFLMELLYKTIEREFTELINENVRLSFIGNWQVLPEKLVAKITKITTDSVANSGLHLLIALNYGAQQEILAAAKDLARKYQQGDLNLEDINEDDFAKKLALADAPPVDLLIRTSGEIRLSNFLLWQIAYAELYFTDVLWPDFSEDDFNVALAQFSLRKRRYGGL